MDHRGVDTLRHSRTHLLLRERCTASDFNDLDTQYCVGDPRTVSFNLGYYKTLTWNATTPSRIDCRGLFHSIGKISCPLLCKVRSQCDWLWSFFWSSACASFTAVSCLQLAYLSPALLVCRNVPDLCTWSLLIVVAGLKFHRDCYFQWHSSNSLECAVVCAWTTPHP